MPTYQGITTVVELLLPGLQMLQPNQVTPTLELSTMVAATWGPSVVESVSLWIGRPPRSTHRMV